MRPRLLFSAPHDFLDLSSFDSIFDIERREIWFAEELTPSDAEVWVPNPGQHFVITESILELFPRLHLVATPSTGINHIDQQATETRHIRVLSLLDDREALESISASAEFTFLHLLNALRRLDTAVDAARGGRWRNREAELRGREVQGRTVGIVGFGRIGRRLAKYLTAFEASVQAHDPYVSEMPPEVEVCSDLSDLFRNCEVVVVCCSLTPETTKLITGDLVRLLPQGGTLINTSRGEVLDEASVCETLRSRTDVSVATDVLAGEVLNQHHSSCLWEFAEEGRVVITPHVAGVTRESQQKAAHAALRLAAGFLHSETLRRVDTGFERSHESDHVSANVEIGDSDIVAPEDRRR